MYICTTADLGPDFIAWAGVIHGRPVAVVTPRAHDDSTIAAQAAELLHRAGISCASCTTLCPVGLVRKEA
jgi:hypothetical protein